MFQYVDLYMRRRPKGLRHVILNVYGGESLHHPDIISILTYVRKAYEAYKQAWHLTVTTTTNGIVKSDRMRSIAHFIDEFTMSYHTENTAKQKQQFISNLELLTAAKKRVKCVVLMHNEEKLFDDAIHMIKWLEDNQVRYLARQLDEANDPDPAKAGMQFPYERTYGKSQIKWFDNYYNNKTFGTDFDEFADLTESPLSAVGRACCGGRQICTNGNYKQRHFYIINRFTNWFCSVNRFFLYVKQVNGEIFVNRDCKMNFQGKVGAIGNLADSQNILDDLARRLDQNDLPVIQCAKERCMCGLCAPKAENLSTYHKIMEKYIS